MGSNSAQQQPKPKRRKVGDGPGPGRKPFKPTDEQRQTVKLAAGLGIDQDSICGLVLKKDGSPITQKTLTKYFATELATGKAEAKTKVAGAFFKQCLGGNLTAQIFFLKTQCRWKETQVVENTGPDGQPLPSQPASLVQVYLPAKDGSPT